MPRSKAPEPGRRPSFRRSRFSRRHRRRRTCRVVWKIPSSKKRGVETIAVEFAGRVQKHDVRGSKPDSVEVPGMADDHAAGPGNASPFEKRGRGEGEISVVARERVGDRRRRRSGQQKACPKDKESPTPFSEHFPAPRALREKLRARLCFAPCFGATLARPADAPRRCESGLRLASVPTSLGIAAIGFARFRGARNNQVPRGVLQIAWQTQEPLMKRSL